MFDSATLNALSGALDGLALRRRTIAREIVNLNTLSCHSMVAAVESALAKPVAEGSSIASAAMTVSEAPTWRRRVLRTSESAGKR